MQHVFLTGMAKKYGAKCVIQPGSCNKELWEPILKLIQTKCVIEKLTRCSTPSWDQWLSLEKEMHFMPGQEVSQLLIKLLILRRRFTAKWACSPSLVSRLLFRSLWNMDQECIDMLVYTDGCNCQVLPLTAQYNVKLPSTLRYFFQPQVNIHGRSFLPRGYLDGNPEQITQWPHVNLLAWPDLVGQTSCRLPPPHWRSQANIVPPLFDPARVSTFDRRRPFNSSITHVFVASMSSLLW